MTSSFAQPIEETTFISTDAGWYDDTGSHDPGNTNYLAGTIVDFMGNKTEFHNFSVFDLSGYSGRVDSAVLRLFMPIGGFSSNDPTETFQLNDFAGDLTALIEGNGGVGAYDDLGDGTVYGAESISLADENTFVDVQINGDGLAAIEAALGGNFVIGGSVITLDPTDETSEWVFALTGDPTPSLIITAIPEPGTFGVLASVFGFMMLKRRRS